MHQSRSTVQMIYIYRPSRATALVSNGNAGMRLRIWSMSFRNISAAHARIHGHGSWAWWMGTPTDIVELRTRKGFSANQWTIFLSSNGSSFLWDLDRSQKAGFAFRIGIGLTRSRHIIFSTKLRLPENRKCEGCVFVPPVTLGPPRSNRRGVADDNVYMHMYAYIRVATGRRRRRLFFWKSCHRQRYRELRDNAAFTFYMHTTRDDTPSPACPTHISVTVNRWVL